MTTPKFKIGDRVKWRDCEGRELSGAVMVAANERGQVTVREHRDELFVARWHESHLSLDVPAPKTLTSLVRDLAEAANDVWIERTAKEAAQKELALAANVAKCLREELKHAQVSAASNYTAYCESMSQLSTAQKELADVRKELADLRKDLADIRIISKRLAL